MVGSSCVVVSVVVVDVSLTEMVVVDLVTVSVVVSYVGTVRVVQLREVIVISLCVVVVVVVSVTVVVASWAGLTAELLAAWSAAKGTAARQIAQRIIKPRDEGRIKEVAAIWVDRPTLHFPIRGQATEFASYWHASHYIVSILFSLGAQWVRVSSFA
jgi:hypothetical protein